MRIIDCHAHIFPEKIATKASSGIGDFYGVTMNCVGSSEHLLEKGSKAGVDTYWVHSVATTAHQVRAINSFIAEQCSIHPEFVGFGTLHPDVEDVAAEVENIIALGLRGVKMHPDFQRFNIDDDKALPIYECIAGRLPLIVHTGDYRYDFSSPKRMARVLKMFPELDCICSHFGGWSVWDEAYEHLGSCRCWADTSSTTGMLNDPAYVRRLVDMWGCDRLLFGSDFPMWDHTEEVDRVLQLGLSDSQLELIMHKNAEDFLQRSSKA
ncbi:MAG: amidohydrolase family protein [Clostridia bacterium]|nr:amidohydrolase family protein [Clostridia bacterium]